MSDDTPIVPQDYLGGVTVIDIGDVRVARGMSRRERGACLHQSVVYDQAERRIYCEQCESTLHPFDAFVRVVEYFDTMQKKLLRREEKIREAEQFSIRSRAAKALDAVWRGRTMAPCCPSCRAGLLPEDFADGVRGCVSREFERAARQRKGDPR